MAIVLLLCGVLILLYSPWVHQRILTGINTRFADSDPKVSVGSLSLRFPLTVELGDLSVVAAGDTMIAAGHLRADMCLLPLLAGRADAERIVLTDGIYRMGGPDSAMTMIIRADSITMQPVSVALPKMHINVEEGLIAGGTFDLTLNNDTTTSSEPSQPSEMAIKLGKIRLNDFTYRMQMMPIIDTLTARIASAELQDGTIDMLTQKISLHSFTGTSLGARYIVPDSAAIAAGGPYPVTSTDSTTTAPWTVEIDTIGFDNSQALYTTAGVEPLPGLDFAYIAVDSLDLHLSHFYNQASTVRLPMTLTGTERCGVRLTLDGTLDIDETALNFRQIQLTTPRGTDVAFEGLLGMGDMATDPDVPLQLYVDGGFAPGDLGDMFPAFAPYFAAIPSAEDILLTLDAVGTFGSLDLAALSLKLNRCVNLEAKGSIDNMMNPDLLGGDIALNGHIINVNNFKKVALGAEASRSVNIPPMTLAGHVAMASGRVNGKLTARTGSGRIALDGRWNSRSEGYDATLTAAEFPVAAFMPLLGVGNTTADLAVKGHGYSPFKKSTVIDADLYCNAADYADVTYKDISCTAHLADGLATVKVNSNNTDADFTLDASGNLDGDTYRWQATLDSRNIDLYALKFSTTPASIEAMLDAEATIGPGTNDLSAGLNIADLFYRQPKGTISMSNILLNLSSSDTLTTASIVNRDMRGSFKSEMTLTALTDAFSRAAAIMAEDAALYRIDIDTIAGAIPPFVFNLKGGRNNLVGDILAPSNMSIQSFDISAAHDSLLTFNANAQRFQTGDMRLDSLYAGMHQHGRHIHFDAGMLNKPGNLNQWHKVAINGAAQGNTLAMRLSQQNLAGKTGFDIGLKAESNAADSSMTVSVAPITPVIGYQQWQANEGNYITYVIPTQQIDANLRMTGGNSSLAIYSEDVAGQDSTAVAHKDLVVKLGDIHLADWIAVNPFAPPMQGDVNADMRLNRFDGMLTGHGSASIVNFLYGKQKVADFKADFDVAATPAGTIHAKADLMVDGKRTITLAGALNDSTATSPLDLDFSMIQFPLSAANPFLPATVGRLSGTLNGSLRIRGTQEAPIFNGTLDFDSTAIKLALTGTPYRFSNTPISVVDNIVDVNNFTISGCNANPLTVNGRVDLSKLDNVGFNLTMKADNMLIVDTKRAAKGADIYGKGFISLDAAATGSMKFMAVNANLTVNSGTNVTYVIPDATSAITNRSTDDMVKFVNFTDTLAVTRADSLLNQGMAMLLDAKLTIEDGTIINVDLSTDGKNRAQIQSNGTLNYSMTPLNNGRLTGRLNINKGFIRYTPPFMSEKNFSFDGGSYVSFSGNMMNPTLNIHATDILKANVTQTGQNSRLVNFDIKLGVTGTLDNMNVGFDLSTQDDITVANELETMSPQQRANQAMNLLLYNVYTGPGTKGDASMAGNPLFSFLESQINSWAASNIKGVDLSFGIDQYDRTYNGSTSSTMSYSYQVSKSLFDDRFKIVVGGNYSTDANVDENFSQNLINDISFEYFLNKGRTIYVRLFRHTGYESILEGEITQTGVGFVYRRKLRRVGDMFLPEGFVRRRIERENKKLEESNHTDQ